MDRQLIRVEDQTPAVVCRRVYFRGFSFGTYFGTYSVFTQRKRLRFFA